MGNVPNNTNKTLLLTTVDIYMCGICGEMFLSRHTEHRMEQCWCKKTMVDWSQYYTRFSGEPILLKTVKVDIDKKIPIK